MRFLLKANEMPLWARFQLFSPALYFSPFTLLFFQICFSACPHCRSFTRHSALFSGSALQHLIHPAPLWGAAWTIKGFVGEPSPRSAPSGATAGLRG